MTKTIDTLPQDIIDFLSKPQKVNEEALHIFCDNVAKIFRERIEKTNERSDETIRMSKLGTKDRKLWFDAHTPKTEDNHTENQVKFLYGDLIEQLLLFLARSAGHSVEETQSECELDGIKGHKDVKLDGLPTDIKSASKYGFRKFATGSILKGDDPFGYIAQLSAYMEADKAPTGALVAINKETGDIAVVKLEKVDTIDARQRIKECKAIVAMYSPPIEKCYPDEPDGKSGNMKLNTNCNWCKHKNKCWDGLRAFQYSTGPRYLTQVVKTPDVPEIFTTDKLDSSEED